MTEGECAIARGKASKGKERKGKERRGEESYPERALECVSDE
jgi:hypothetical protein